MSRFSRAVKDIDWKEVAGTVAPGIATALGGPLAGIATQILSDKLLGKSDGTQDEVATAILTGGADALLKVKQAENEFRIKLKELDVKLEEIYATDRVSARDMAKTNMVPQITLSVIFIGGYFITLFSLHGLLFNGEPMNKEIMVLAGSLVGVFTRELSGIMQFWFGSSVGSKEKTAALANSSPVA